MTYIVYKYTRVFFQQWLALNSHLFYSLFLPQLSYPVQWIMEAVSKTVSNFLQFTSSAAADVGTSSQRMESAADVSRSLHLSKSDIYQWLVLIVLRINIKLCFVCCFKIASLHVQLTVTVYIVVLLGFMFCTVILIV